LLIFVVDLRKMTDYDGVKGMGADKAAAAAGMKHLLEKITRKRVLKSRRRHPT
jgi:hypothetical protein